MKIILVACSLVPADDRYKRFVKLIKRSSEKFFEVYPGLWILKTNARPIAVSRRLDALLEDELSNPRGEDQGAPLSDRLFVCTVLNDADHRNGWISQAFWEWLNAT